MLVLGLEKGLFLGELRDSALRLVPGALLAPPLAAIGWNTGSRG